MNILIPRLSITHNCKIINICCFTQLFSSSLQQQHGANKICLHSLENKNIRKCYSGRKGNKLFYVWINPYMFH